MTDREAAPTLEQLETVLGPEEGESAAETMRAVMEEIGGGDAPGEEAPLETDNSAGDQPRDEKGRFAAKATEGDGGEEGAQPAAEAEAENKGAEAEGEHPAQAEQQEGEQDPLEPPTDWELKDQELFRALDRKGQEFVLARIKAADDLRGQATELSTKYQALEAVLAPHRDAWARNGLDEANAVRQLVALSDLANTKPIEFAQMFIRERGLTAEQLFGTPAAAAAATAKPNGADPAGAAPELGEDTDPTIRALHSQIAQLTEKINGFQTESQRQAEEARRATGQRETQQREAQEQQLRQEITEFANAVDSAGKPAHPYFAEVKGFMGPLVDSGQAKDLQQAYDMACRAHPDVNAKIEAARKAQQARDQAKEQREKAKAAGQAGSSISGSPGGKATSSEPTGDIREDMRRQFAEAGHL